MDLRFTFQRANEMVGGARSALLVSHQRPDGDTLGSTLAFAEHCRRRGIAVRTFCVDQVPDQLAFLPGAESYSADRGLFSEKFDLLVVFDCGDLRHAGVADLVAAMPRRPRIVSFDHHIINENYADVNVVDPAASSTCEVVYRHLTECGAEISRDQATCLLTGLFTDTDGFSNPATTERALEASSDLMRRGARMFAMFGQLRNNKSVAVLRLWGQVLGRLKFDERLGVASTAVLADDLTAAGGEQVEGIANFLSHLLDSKVVLVLREAPGGLVKGSFRTVEPDIDVAAVAKVLGGGGHRKAAGFCIPGRICEGEKCWRVE